MPVGYAKLGRYSRVYVNKSPAIANRPVAEAKLPNTNTVSGAFHRLGARKHQGRAIIVAMLLGLLTACEPSPPPGQSPARPVPPGPYPDLASVPPRPQLSYTVAQRQEIASQLVADRAHAQYAAAQLAYATGAAAAPPAPPEPAPAATPAPPPPAAAEGDAGIANAYLATNLSDVRDTGKLRQFMRRLDREAPDPWGPRTLAEAIGLGGPDDPPAPGGSEAKPVSSEAQPATNVLGGVLGVDGTGTPPAAGTASLETLPTGALLALVPFAPGSTALPGDADAQLARAVREANAAETGLKIVAPAGATGLGPERARVVAASLVRQGASADRLSLGMEGSGDEVRVYLASHPAT